jgi:Ca2+-binding RTX toxin-like protein
MKSKFRRRLLLASFALALLLSPSQALAATCYNNLTSGDGYTYDFNEYASVSTGPGPSGTAFDNVDTFGYWTVDMQGSAYYETSDTNACTLQLGGREVVYPVDAPNGGSVAEITPRVFVPATGAGFVRFLVAVTNTSGAPYSGEIRLEGRHSSGNDTTIGATSSGDAAVALDDSWATAYNAVDSDTPAVAHLWRSVAAPTVTPSNLVLQASTPASYVTVEYDVDLAAGETKLLMYVAALRADDTAAQAFASDMAADPTPLFEGMSEADLADVLNWDVANVNSDPDGDGIGRLTDNCRLVANPSQLNTDGDTQGDACDLDDDGDGVLDVSDSCPTTAGTGADGCPVSTTTGGGGGGTGGGGTVAVACPAGSSAGVTCFRSGDRDGLVIVGSTGGDTLVGSGGRDVIYGEGGDDVIRGAAGGDILRGGPGDDLLVGGSGVDVIRGGDGNDTIVGGGGDDRLLGGDGNDRVFGGFGADFIRGGAGDDTLAGGAGADTLAGDDGNDTVRGDSGPDRLFGGAGDDVLLGGPGVDELIGGPGN